MSTLYELTAEYRQLLEMAEDPETDEQALADTMEAIGGEIEDKADGYAKIIRQLTEDAAGIEDEMQRLEARRCAMDHNAKNLKGNLQAAMVATGKTKFKTLLFSYSVQKNPASVVMDGDKVPEKYLIEQPPKIDRVAIRNDLKAGVDLAGIAHLEQGESLRIR